MYVGIDFGTTNSSVAIFNEETFKPEVKILPSGYGTKQDIMRTFLYYTEDGQVISDNIQATNLTNSDRSVLSLKRQIMKDINFKKVIDGKELSSEQMIADFIDYLLKDAEINLEQITRLVLSVPTNYTEELKDKMERAVAILGIKEPWFIDEPVAVLWDHKNEKIQGDLMLVFDFGGGTLDLAVMRKSENDELKSPVLPASFGKQSNYKKGKIVAKVGSTIGGDDLDEMIMKHFIRVGKEDGNPVCERLDMEIFDREERLQGFRKMPFYSILKNIAEITKIQLSNNDEVPFHIPTLHPKLDRQGIKGIITQEQFNNVAKKAWDGVREGLEEINKRLLKVGMDLEDIEVVLLSGVVV